MKKNKKNNKIKPINQPIIGIIIVVVFISAILFTIMSSLGGASKNEQSQQSNADDNTKDVIDIIDPDLEFIGLVQGFDQNKKTIHLLDIESGKQQLLSYDGSSDVRDKFDQVISMAQIDIGQMVDVSYRKDRVSQIKISKQTWEYKRVSNLTVELSKGIIKIGKTNYNFNNNISVLDLDYRLVDLEDINEEAEFTVRGYEDTIYSMIISKGHGKVSLIDDEDFLGGIITIGYENPTKIEKGIQLTVKEGSFNLTVENENYSATKYIVVERGNETIVSLAGLGPSASPRGLVNFKLQPEGADLYIDGEFVDSSETIDLAYGAHKIKISYIGYLTYEGIIEVDNSNKTVKAKLPEISSEKTPDINITEKPLEGGEEINIVDVSSEVRESIYNNDDYRVDKEHFVYIQTPRDTSVYLNGEFMMTSPGRIPKVLGKHIITFIEKDFQTKSYPVEIEDNGLDKYFNLPELEKK